MSKSASGATLLALAVMLGAFGAHGLRDKLDAYAVGIYEKAVFYHFIHAMGLLIVPMMVRAGSLTPAGGTRIWILLFTGIVLFSGSLYLLAVSNNRWLGAVTPLGGLAFIAAWLLLAWETYSSRGSI